MRRCTLPSLVAMAFLTGCASTTVETTGSPPRHALCQADKPALPTVVYWAPQWRPDQKEPLLREAAALRGIEDFLKGSGCLAVSGVHRLSAENPLPTNEELLRLAADSRPIPERILLVVVRELGPRLTIGIPVIVAGGTEVLIDVRLLAPKSSEPLANAQTRWRNGGAFVIKGVKTLDRDMSAALEALLMQSSAAR